MNPLYNLLTGAFTGQPQDSVSAFSAMEDNIKQWLEGIGVPSLVLYVVAVLAAVLLGYFSYRCSKVVVGVLSAGVGYLLVGETLYRFLIDAAHYQLYEVVRYSLAGVAALIFFVLGYKFARCAFFALMGAAGYIVAAFYIRPYTDTIWLSIGIGIVVALLSALLFRIVFIAVTSLTSAVVAVTALSRIFPAVALFQLKSSWIACGIVLGLLLLFFIVQMIVTEKGGENGRFFKRRRRRERIIREY